MQSLRPILIFLFSGSLAFLICPFNYESKFYIVGLAATKKTIKPKALKANNSAQTNGGVPYGLADSLCQGLGLRLANITATEIPGIAGAITQCNVGPVAWFNTYESLPFFGCNALSPQGVVVMGINQCVLDYSVICQVVVDPLKTTTFTETISSTIEVITSATELITVTATETETSYFVTEIALTLTEGTNAIITASTTITDCSTIIRTRTDIQTIIPICSYFCNDCPYSSSSCRSRNSKLRKELERVNNNWQSCPTSSNNFFLVHNTNIQVNETAEQGCQALGYQVANLTLPIIFNNIVQLLGACNVAKATFNSYYGYTPFCGQLSNSTMNLVVDEFNFNSCSTPEWIICMGGGDAVTTETVPTGPFTTEIFTVLQTEVDVSTVTLTLVESTTENQVVTEYETSYLPVTTVITETVFTTTSTNLWISTTTCNFHPASCTTTSTTTTNRYTCIKPGCFRTK